MKSTGELLASCIKFIVVKADTFLLRKAEPKHVKRKTFFVANALVIIILVLASVSSIYLENWSFLEGLYAWFITFTTIGFGDYVHLESISRKASSNETPQYRVILYGILLCLPYLIGLSLVSCILSCIVDSVDQIREARDRCIKCCPSISSLIRRFFRRKRLSYEVKPEDRHVCDIPREVSREEDISCENKKSNL